MPIKSETVTTREITTIEKEVPFIEVLCQCEEKGCNLRLTVYECENAPDEYNLSFSQQGRDYAGKGNQIIIPKVVLNQLGFDIFTLTNPPQE